MSEILSRMVEGHRIITSGSLVCPSMEKCDGPFFGEPFEDYVFRHARDHNLGAFDDFEDAERNLGLWCFYFFHKYVWENVELCPDPFWEIHAFIAEPEWSEADLEQRTPMEKRTFRIAPAHLRKPGERRRMKQVELPRQLQKTSIGARAHTVFEHLHEYFVNNIASFRTIVRSATGKNTRDTLAIVRRMSTKSANIMRLYGIWVLKCLSCTAATQMHDQANPECPACGETRRTRWKRISLINEARGAGGLGKDQVSFRWLTDAARVDAIAAYSVWVAGLETETVGQRPNRYKWDDPQTDKNSRTSEMRAKIMERFDESVRQLQFGGELLVFDTRKYVDDFAGKIRQEPLASLFFSLHRKVRWATNEPDNPPYVVGGYRYYYPIKGNGEKALDAAEVGRLELQMSERNFSAEYLNEPLDPTKSLFKREHFRILDVDKPADLSRIPAEVRYGLGRNLTPGEQRELEMFGVRTVAYNFCDPAGKEEQSVKGDDTFVVGARIDRYGSIFITYLAAGKWPSTRVFDELERANAYNRPQFTEYEMPASEMHVRNAFDAWQRGRSEALSTDERPMVFQMPMIWASQPKGTKASRIEGMEPWTSRGRFFILSSAGAPELIEKYIQQWVGWLVSDHDDGPDATSRILKYLYSASWQEPAPETEETPVRVENGVASISVSMLREHAAVSGKGGQLWGQGGRNAA